MIYNGFASVYDALMKHTDYGQWVDYIESVFKHLGRCPQTVVDLACGTGSITTLLARRGYQMTGVDISGEMLFAAREKARKMGLQIPFICQDMRVLSLHRPVDAVVCMCDGFNYLLTEADLHRTLMCIHQFLKPGGLLFFDISSYFKLSSILGNKTMADTGEDVSLIWNNSFERQESLLTMELTFFIREGNHYNRMEEIHVQRAYQQEQVEDALIQCGFSNIKAFAPFSLDIPKKRSQRIFFAALKK